MNNKKQSIEEIHSQKLSNLGIKVSKATNLVYSLSSKQLSTETIKLLENGPKFVVNCNTSSTHDKVEFKNLCQTIGINEPNKTIHRIS